MKPWPLLLVAASALAQAPAEEPPLSGNEPMYFVAGASSGWSARFQISFKYRLFDSGSGFGRDHPSLTGLHFAYTQNSIWDLQAASKPFTDTSYRPSLFWGWQSGREHAWIDGGRVGIEHESNGREGEQSRSLNIAFIRPEWRWKTLLGGFEFTPKAYYYLDKSENPDLQQYRGYVDWRGRWNSNDEKWTLTVLGRLGTAGKGSLQLDAARQGRDLKVGSVSGYYYVQYFNGYGEDLLDYNVRKTAQLRFGFAFVP